MTEETTDIVEEAMTRVGKGLLENTNTRGVWLVRAGRRNEVITYVIAAAPIERWFTFIAAWQHRSSASPLGIALRALGITDVDAWVQEIGAECSLAVRHAFHEVQPLLVPPAASITEQRSFALTVLKVTRLLPRGGTPSLEFTPMQSL